MNGTNHVVPHCEAFPILHSHPSSAQILTSGSYFKILLAWFPPLIKENTFHNPIAQKTILSFKYFNFQTLREYKSVLLDNNVNFYALGLYFISSWIEFWFVNKEPNFLKIFTFSYEL